MNGGVFGMKVKFTAEIIDDDGNVVGRGHTFHGNI